MGGSGDLVLLGMGEGFSVGSQGISGFISGQIKTDHTAILKLGS